MKVGSWCILGRLAGRVHAVGSMMFWLLFSQISSSSSRKMSRSTHSSCRIIRLTDKLELEQFFLFYIKLTVIELSLFRNFKCKKEQSLLTNLFMILLKIVTFDMFRNTIDI